MSDRERQRKFAQQSTIKNSEFDRQNTNATKHSNPMGIGNNVPPSDSTSIKNVYLKDLLIKIGSVLFGIVFFLFIVPLARYFVGLETYSSIGFLFIALIVSVCISYLSSILIKYIVNRNSASG